MPPVGKRGFSNCYDEAAEIEMENENLAISNSESSAESNSEAASEANNDNDVDNEINVNVVVNTDDDNGNGSGEKVQVCHNGETLEIPIEALPAHLEHGDTFGPCEDNGESKEVLKDSKPEEIKERSDPEAVTSESTESTEI